MRAAEDALRVSLVVFCAGGLLVLAVASSAHGAVAQRVLTALGHPVGWLFFTGQLVALTVIVWVTRSFPWVRFWAWYLVGVSCLGVAGTVHAWWRLRKERRRE